MNLLFDLDGTLADPLKSFCASLRYGFAALGLPPPSEDEMKSCIGPPLQESLLGLLAPDHMHLADLALQKYREHHAQNAVQDYEFYPGVRETLTALQTRHRLFVATSKPWTYARPILENARLAGFFEKIYGAELDGVRSRKGDLIAHLLETEGLAASETLMIGDRKHDALGAQKNGVPCIGVLWGFGSEQELQAAGTLGPCRSFDELRVFIEQRAAVAHASGAVDSSPGAR